MRIHTGLVIGLVACAAFEAPAAAKQCKVKGKLESYYKPSTLPNQDTRCEMKNGKCKKIDLKGLLYMPDAKTAPGPHSLLIFNHGSEPDPGDMCGLAEYFVPLGYVVFLPRRRGHGESTGASFAEYTTKYCSTLGNANACKMEYLQKQVDDVDEAIKFVKSQTDKDGKAVVDPDRIAITGHSFGGIVTLFANAKDLGQRAAISSAASSQSWEINEHARKATKEAVRNGVAAVYMFEPMNDQSIEPLLDLSQEAIKACRQFQVTLYPPKDTNSDNAITAADYEKDARDIAHGRHMFDTGEWGPAVHEFMKRNFKSPAKHDTLCKGTSLQLDDTTN